MQFLKELASSVPRGFSTLVHRFGLSSDVQKLIKTVKKKYGGGGGRAKIFIAIISKLKKKIKVAIKTAFMFMFQTLFTSSFN